LQLGKFPLHSLQNICDAEVFLEGLSIHDENMQINKGTIISHIWINSLLVDSYGARSTMENVKPVILKFALWKQEAGQ
jgi:hypothetical protein